MDREALLSSKKGKKLALGKGLGALIPDVEPGKEAQKDYFQCDISLIHSNRFQPRRNFSEDELNELAQSIKEQGVIQPVLIRKDDIGYELIAGERRLRAAKLAGFEKIPAVVKVVSDLKLLEMSIVENIQREALNPIEEAEAYHRLISEFNLTQEKTAEKVGKSRPAVANFLRLLQLPDDIKASIMDSTLSMGHARALLGIESSAQLNAAYRTIVSKGLSVRETEALIKNLKTKKKKASKPSKNSEQRHLTDVADDLARYFGTKVQIIKHAQKGKVEIEFYSDDDLDRLLGLLKPS
ncbi:MAG: ParB/RepB/Spo0J family partition protein [Deltaproteobacteria bacterium]|nr:ParB/RepB/Spo0J family partition protein [Deltaproteobacteria bacterium]